MSEPAAWIAGVDGCRGGWVVVVHPIGCPDEARVTILKSFADVLALPEQPAMTAIDIPIGLPERAGPGGRLCDGLARAPLGQRRSSVFSVPAREAVYASSYDEACRVAERLSDPPRRVARQTFHLFPKIREVDALMTADLQRRVVECHPELAFWRLNGRVALEQPKKVRSAPWPAGLSLRRKLLRAAGYASEVMDGANALPRAVAGPDDILDAFANAAAAEAIVTGKAVRVPDEPASDAKGLRMEIWG